MPARAEEPHRGVRGSLAVGSEGGGPGHDQSPDGGVPPDAGLAVPSRRRVAAPGPGACLGHRCGQGVEPRASPCALGALRTWPRCRSRWPVRWRTVTGWSPSDWSSSAAPAPGPD